MGANAVGDAVHRDVEHEAPVVDQTLEARILAATSRCIARWGVSKTTIDDIARDAGCSRATIYRVVPGGKQGLLLAAAHHEIGRVLRVLDLRLQSCPDLATTLTVMVTEGARFVAGNEALQYLVVHEPEVVLPHVSFDGLEPLLFRVAEFASPHLRRFLDDDTAWRTGEWMARLVTSYVFDDTPSVDLTDPACTARILDTYVLPGLTQHGSPSLTPAACAGA